MGICRWTQGGRGAIRIRWSRRFLSARGFTFVEVLIVVVIIGLLAAIAGPVAGKWIRRSEDMAALATVRQVLAVARLEAVKTSSNVVVVFGANPDNTIHLVSFRDRATRCAGGANVGNLCTQDGQCPGSFCSLGLTTSANDGNGQQDAGEPTLGDVTLSVRIHFWKEGGAKDSLAGAALFDTCVGPPDPSGRCLVFLPSGGITPPASGLPTSSNGRGLYLADWQGKNYFRVTVESDFSGKARADKYVGSGYVTSGWKWQ